jgi:hypothetical protein
MMLRSNIGFGSFAVQNGYVQFPMLLVVPSSGARGVDEQDQVEEANMAGEEYTLRSQAALE